ncbi:unnamed protein product [Brassicogethes aeneus]|uniref:B30.2/SPRY domain-containing protein n=1 Tax=Brassicogethes aeneus TaxID=1431903 RepID=A0A9P0FPT5_BRAAE|nr:unnamed protein product [Brassicogethes aeneus]
MYFRSCERQRANVKNKAELLANRYCSSEVCFSEIKDGILQCKCGENDAMSNKFEWKFVKEENTSDIVFSNENKDILFHPTYSHGTAVLRGEKPFAKNRHHYWEVKMISSLYGTDVMVGVGSANIRLADWKYQFCSLLGLDGQSWGYSYKGNIQHDQLGRKYGVKYGMGSLVGVHLDMWRGTLEYYVNRRPMGTAFRNLKRHEVYPMLSSTAAKSAVRITCAVSTEPTLQMYCLKVVVKKPALYREFKQEMPQIARIYEKKYFWIRPTIDIQTRALAVPKRQNKRERSDGLNFLTCEENLTSDSETEDVYGGLEATNRKKSDKNKRIRSLGLEDDCVFAIV